MKKFAELDEQKQAILRQKVEYEQKVEYFQSRIADIMNFYSMESLEAGDLADSMENALRIREKIEATATDEEKPRLVHKHIKEVNVEKQTIVYTFNEKKVKEAPAKYVTITFYDGTQQYFHFISTDGKGGHWIDSDIDGNVLGDLPINIERKITNQTKLRIRAKEKERKKAAFESIYSPDRLYLYGCREMAEYLCLSKNSIQRFCKEGFFKDALSKYGKKTYILDAERALEIMRASEEAWIKKAVQNFDELHGKEETK